MIASGSLSRCVASSSRIVPRTARIVPSSLSRVQRSFADATLKPAPSAIAEDATLADVEAKGDIRIYRYVIDVHGQLFLHDTEPKNLTSCFKEPKFLNNFMSRIKPIRASDHDIPRSTSTPRERKEVSLQKLWRICEREGYQWVSVCAGEYNLIRAVDSPIVFRELRDDGTLMWAGNLESQFQPSQLRVCVDSGYLYHPSPVIEHSSPQRRRASGSTSSNEHPFGTYSLLSSALVQQQLASGLELEPDRFEEKYGGSIAWQGSRYDIGTVNATDFAYRRAVSENEGQ